MSGSCDDCGHDYCVCPEWKTPSLSSVPAPEQQGDVSRGADGHEHVFIHTGRCQFCSEPSPFLPREEQQGEPVCCGEPMSADIHHRPYPDGHPFGSVEVEAEAAPSTDEGEAGWVRAGWAPDFVGLR